MGVLRAASSAVERLPHTQEVVGSNPTPPTKWTTERFSALTPPTVSACCAVPERNPTPTCFGIMPQVESSLVTGADGFIGRALTVRLTALGVRVYRLVHVSHDSDAIAADLGSTPPPSLKTIRPESVFHLAGRVHKVDDGRDAEAAHFRVTVDGTRSLLDESVDAGVRAFVFFSTCAVWREGGSQVLDEECPPAPDSAYGRAKLEAERLVLERNGVNGMRTVCLRLPLVYGPGHKGNLPRMIRAIERGVFPPWPDYGGRRSYVNVDDVSDAAILVAGSPRAAGRIYLVAEPRPYTTREIYELVLRSLGRRAPGWRVPPFVLRVLGRGGDAGRFMLRRRMPFDSAVLAKMAGSAEFSSARIQRELGFNTSRTLEASMGSLVSRASA